MKKINFGDGRYYVTKFGQVFNTITGKELKPNDIGGGYLQVTLCDNGYRKSFLLHRLVALHYNENPDSFTQINHKDRDKSNNISSNLEWVSPSQNVQHSYDSGREVPSKHGRLYRKLDQAQKKVIRSLIGEVPIIKIAGYFKVNRSTIRLCLH